MTIELTAKGSGYYRVFVDSLQVSQHTTEREAAERAINEKTDTNNVYYDHDYHVQVGENAMPIIGSTIGPSIIWETTFASDGAYSATNENGWKTTSLPIGWDGLKAAGDDGSITGQSGGGEGGSNAIRLVYDEDLSQPTTSMLKHLTGSSSTGYPELYIRYKVKLPNNFRVSDGTQSGSSDIAPWKWGRLWQNTGTTNDGTWTENRADSHWVVWNWNGEETNGIWLYVSYGVQSSISGPLTVGPNAMAKGSAGGPRLRTGNEIGSNPDTNADSLGYFNHVGDGDWDLDSWAPDGADLLNNTTQTWHTIEWRWKCATSDTANDGIFQMWFDGVLQNTSPLPSGGANPVTQGPQKTADITAITKANPAVVTLANDNDSFQTGDSVTIASVGGMTEINGSSKTITRLTSTTFQVDGEDSSAYTTYTSGGRFDLPMSSSHFGGSIPTAANPGFNALTFFDNMSHWHKDWKNVAVDGWIDISDVVIATTRIGHAYNPTDDGSTAVPGV